MSFNVVLFGYGKMGKNIYRTLQNSKDVDNIYVVDPIFTDEKVVPLQFKTFDAIPLGTKLDAAFVASNSVTHCDVLQQILSKGIKNIFCEKPMCLTQDEYDIIAKLLPKDTRFVVDYILRSSLALGAFQKQKAQLESEGYKLDVCNIDYGKDKTQDPRRFKDVGVYEELYHIWDLCLNGPLFGEVKDVKVLRNIYTPDPEIRGRCIQQRFKYQLQNRQDPFIVNLLSSFQKKQLVRHFICCFRKGNDRKVLALGFDDHGQDWCRLIHNDLSMETQSFPSHTKLDTMINDSLVYFKTGRKATYFHDAQDSINFHSLMVRLKQTGPLDRESIQKRILAYTR